jgi:archaemetzincin
MPASSNGPIHTKERSWLSADEKLVSQLDNDLPALSLRGKPQGLQLEPSRPPRRGPKPKAQIVSNQVMQRRSFVTLVTSAGLWARAPALLAAGARSVVVQPFGPGSATPAALVGSSLTALYDVDVRVAKVEPLPAAAFYTARGRYRAEKLLERLSALQESAFRVLGVTAADISTTKGNVFDWGILGLASIDGRACVLSSFRCRRRARDSRHVADRLGKTAVHELGHTFGLEHCPTRGCLMHDGEGTVLTTDGERDLCSGCRSKLATRGFLRASAQSPWA